MLLETYKKEDVVLTCILPPRESEDSSNHQYRLLEIDVNSKFFVLRLGRRDSEERRVFQSPLVQDALRFCRENSDKWCRQLKVIHHIYPKEHLTEQRPNTNEKPTAKTRKISLGDKKTVKSASFRFSASLPEDLRPINRPLPRRPDQTTKPQPQARPQPPPKPQPRVEIEVHDQHVYSNVAEEVEEPQSLRSQVVAQHRTVWATPINNTSLDTNNSSKASSRKGVGRESIISTQPPPSLLEDRLSEDFKTKIVVHGYRVPGFDENNYADRSSKYRVIRKPVNSEVRVKPLYKTRVQIGPDYSAGSDVPYSVVVDQVSTAEDNVYAEIGDSYPTHDRRYFSFNYQRRLHHRYDYQTGGSDGTFSGTTTSSSNAEESSV